MGYYNDVRICTNKNGYDELSKFVSKAIIEKNLDPKYNLLDLTDVFTADSEKHYFGWNNIKWYDDDLYVRTILDGLNHLYDLNIPYEFARIGDDIDDIVEDVSCGYDLDFIPIIRCFNDGEMAGNNNG